MYGVTRPNNVDILTLFLIGVLSCITSHSPPKHFTYTVLISTLQLLVPQMVLILYVCYALEKKKSITQYLIRKYEHLQRCMQAASLTYQAEVEVETESDTVLSARLTNKPRRV